MNSTIHLWDSLSFMVHPKGDLWTKCGRRVNKQMNVLYASTAERLKVRPDKVCKTCYRLGPLWLGKVR